MTWTQAWITFLAVIVALYFFEGRAEFRARFRRMIGKVFSWFRYRKGRTTSGSEGAAENFVKSYLIAVSCTLGIRAEENGIRGLQWFPFEAQDGGCSLMEGIENQGRMTSNKTRQHYFYFRFLPDVVESFRRSLIYVIVEYHDAIPHGDDLEQENIMLAYDAVGGYEISTRFKSLELPMLGDGEWKVSVFSLNDGNFEGRGNGADFRFGIARVNSSKQRELIVRRVTVIRAD